MDFGYLVVLVVAAAIGLLINYWLTRLAVKHGAVDASLEIDLRRELLASARSRVQDGTGADMTLAENLAYEEWSKKRASAESDSAEVPFSGH